jgi:ABC-type multidrug transport system permease subunit
MEDHETSRIDKLIQQGEEYLKTRQELSKLVTVSKSSSMAAGILTSLILFLTFFFVIVFASIALAYAIAAYSGKMYTGFLSVGLLYLVTGLFLYVKRKSLLEEPIANSFIKKFFNADEDEKD